MSGKFVISKSFSKGNADIECKFQTNLCSWKAEKGSAYLLTKEKSGNSYFETPPLPPNFDQGQVHSSSSPLNSFALLSLPDRALYIRNEGIGIKLTTSLSQAFKENPYYPPAHLVFALHSYSGEDRAIELRGRFQDGSVALLWVGRTFSCQYWRRIELSPKLENLVALTFESDAHVFGLIYIQLLRAKNNKHQECLFDQENLCQLLSNDTGTDILYYRRSRFGSPLGQTSLLAQKMGLKAPVVDQQENHHRPEEAKNGDQGANLIQEPDDNANILELMTNQFDNRNSMQMLEPISYIKVRPGQTIQLKSDLLSANTQTTQTIIFKFQYRKRLESQAPVSLQMKLDDKLINLWDSYEESPNEDYPWRTVIKTIVRASLQTCEFSFLFHGDEENALTSVSLNMVAGKISFAFGCLFKNSMCDYDLIQPSVGSGFRTGLLLLQSPQTVSLDSEIKKALFTFADFTGPSEPTVKNGQLAWDDMLSATTMGILSPPLPATMTKNIASQWSCLF